MLPDQGRPALLRLLALTTILLSLALGTNALPSHAAGSAQARLRLSISAPASVAQGQVVTITGTSSKANAGRVKLQIRYSRSAPWVTMKGKRVRNGTFAFNDKVATKRDRWYRVTAKKKGKTSVSRAVKVKVGKASAPAQPAAKWYDLYDVPYVSRYDVSKVTSVNINGPTYTKSLTSSGSGIDYIEFNLSRLCTQMTGVSGLSDATNTGGQAQIRLLTDGTEVFAKQYSLGQSDALALPMTNALRLRIEFIDIAGDSKYAYGSLGSPRVYCSTAIEQGWDN